MLKNATVQDDDFGLSHNNYTVLKDYIVLGLYFIVAIVAIVGNLFVLHVIAKTPKLKTTTFLILANLAVVDCLGGISILLQFIFCLHHFLEQGEHYVRLCGLSKSLQILSYYVSTYSMLFIALDRYLQLQYHTSKAYFKPKYAIGLSWLIGGLFNSTTFVNLRINEYFKEKYHIIGCRIAFLHPSLKTITFRKVRITLLILTQYLIPLVITAILYYKIWQIIKRNSKESLTELNQKQIMFQIKSKKRIIIMLIIIVAAFTLAWLPVHLIHFFNFFVSPLLSTKCNSSTLYVLAYWLGVSSICMNPFIYYWSNYIFRDEVTIILYKLKLSKNRTNNKMRDQSMNDVNGSVTNFEEL